LRLAILTSARRGFASGCLSALAASDRCEVAMVVFSHAKAPNAARQRRRKLEKLFRIGPLGAANGVRMRSWFRDASGEDIEALCNRLNVPFAETPTLNGQRTRRAFAAADSDLGLSLGNSYISQKVFALPKHGMLNVHGEVLPAYQNAQSVIWPIYNMSTETGLTIHEIDSGIDTGPILYQERYPIEFRPTLRETVVATLPITRSRGVAAVVHACEHYAALKAQAQPQAGGARYTTPSIWQFARMCRNNRELYRRIRGAAAPQT
jgi:methionyl-tRNA formyltransferase